jgi:hypothetical protein
VKKEEKSDDDAEDIVSYFDMHCWCRVLPLLNCVMIYSFVERCWKV